MFCAGKITHLCLKKDILTIDSWISSLLDRYDILQCFQGLVYLSSTLKYNFFCVFVAPGRE